MFLLKSKLLGRNKLLNRKIPGIVHPITLTNNATDVQTVFQIFYAKEYDLEVSKEPEWIIDCGANVGYSVIYFANKYANSKIIAIEPDKENFTQLQKNCKPYSNIKLINKAVWPTNTILNLVDPGIGNWGYQTIENSENALFSVETITLDELINQFNIPQIDILKIDIEGGERQLFQSHYENWLPKVKHIAIELHPNISEDIPGIFGKAISTRKFSKTFKGENTFVHFE